VSYPNLNLMLRAAHRRQCLLGLARSAARGLAALTLGVVLAVALDALFALPVAGLLALDALLVAAILWGLGQLLRSLGQLRFDARRVARMLESRLGMTSNALINAVDLREAPRGTVSRRLMDESIELGEVAARRVAVREAISGRGARRAVLGAALAAAGVLALFLLLPGVLVRGLPRLIDPTGDHPPFTLLRFDVWIDPQPLYYGSPAMVLARVAGPSLPDRADLVFAGEPPSERLPLVATDEGFRLDFARAERSRRFYVDTPKGRSDWYTLDVQQVPMFDEVWVSYRYPPHTDLMPRRHRLVGHDIQALSGTEVTLEATSRFPLSAGQVEILSEGQSAGQRETLRLLPTAEAATKVRGSFRLTRSGQLSLRLIGRNQQPGPELREARLIAVQDRPPEVAISDPEPVAFAVEGWTIPVAVEASDDVQVANVELHVQRRPEPSEAWPLETQTLDRRHSQGKAEFDLAQLQARPGDQIRFFASATDNHPDPPQSADSPSHVIQVISHEQYLDYLRMAYRMEELTAEIQQLNERLEQLEQQRQQTAERAEDLLQQLQAGQPLDEPQREQLDQLDRALDEYARQAQELSDQMRERLESPQLYDAEQGYRDQLARLAERLDQQRDRATGLRQTLPSTAPGAVPSAEDLQRLQDALQQLESAATPSDPSGESSLAESEQQARKLMHAERMLSEAQWIQQVMQQQRQLADRFQPLPDQTGMTAEQQRRADRLAQEQERLDQELQEAQRALREAAEKAADDLPRTSSDACRLCDAIDQLGVPQDQRQAARAARQGAGGDARRAAEQAADKLESLAAKCPNAQGVGEELAEGDLDRGLRLTAEGLQRTLEQLSQAQSLPTLGQGSQPRRDGRDGSRSQFGLHGPQPPREAFQARRGRRASDPRGRGEEGSPDGTYAATEVIEAESCTSRAGGAGNLRGVPVGYRDQAEAYFRRLAEEAAATPSSGP
jgi:hypothetical protein